MHDIFFLCRFALDALITFATAWLLVRAAGVMAGVLERLLGLGLAVLIVVAGSGEILGWVGGLGANGFLMAHGMALITLAVWRSRKLADDVQALNGLCRETAAHLRPGRSAAGWLGAGLLLILAGQAVLAALGEPVVYDALTYRLSRIGLWLQDGRITHLATDDQRLNYMPVAPDLVMAWLMGAHSAGYQWAAVGQTIGGALLVGATAGLARLTGLSRSAALGAAALPLGLANVVPQFTSAYTDLFTAGVLASAFYLWLAALRRGTGSALGGAGVALALGAKGTVLYAGPGVLLWVAGCGWRHRASWPVWRSSLVGGTLAALLLLAPGLARNWQAYGGLFGPAESMQQQHGDGLTVPAHWEKLRLNLVATLAQLFEPNAQPPVLRAGSLRVAEALAARLPSADRFSFEGLDRRANLEKLLLLPEPDADVASCGVVWVALFLAGFFSALFQRRREGAAAVVLWGGGVALFGLCLYALLQWHPYSFRFWTLVVPWMAVVVAWWLESLPRAFRLAGWGCLAVCSSVIFWNGTMHTYQAGWPAVRQPGRGLGYSVYSQVRQWTHTLDPLAAPLQVALPVNQPLAAFLRTGDARRIELRRLSQLPATAESAVRDLSGWLVVPARHFSGREGRVEKRLWLFYGDENSWFSLAAYRRRSLDP